MPSLHRWLKLWRMSQTYWRVLYVWSLTTALAVSRRCYSVITASARNVWSVWYNPTLPLSVRPVASRPCLLQHLHRESINSRPTFTSATWKSWFTFLEVAVRSRGHETAGNIRRSWTCFVWHARCPFVWSAVTLITETIVSRTWFKLPMNSPGLSRWK